MRFPHLGWTIGVAVALAAVNVANASVVYTYTAEQPAYTASVNTPVTVCLYLQESLSEQSKSIITTTKNYLISAGISVTREGKIPSDPAKLSSFSFNSVDFNDPSQDVHRVRNLSPTGVQFSEAVLHPQTSGVLLNNTGGGVAVGYTNRVYLGSVTIQTGNTPNQSTNFDVFVDSANPGVTLTGNILDLDQSNSNPAYTGAEDAGFTEFTVTTPAPEPASVALLGSFFGGFLLRRRRM